jgi:hypothetical protein
MLQHSSYPEVSNLDIALGGEKDILCFKISMQNLLIVNIVHGKGDLHQPGHDLMLGEERVKLFLVGNAMKHVSALAIVHHNA